MRIKHRFGFNSGNANITHFLETNKINHKNSGIVTAFEMYEDNEKFSSVRAFMTLHNISSISESVYTVDEIDNAKWLTVRSSWRSLYPYPRENMNYIFTTYDTTNYCEGDVPDYYCRKGAKQNECFMLEKEPNWGSRNFLMLNCVEDELFISQKAEETLRDSELTGFDLYDVFNKSKKRLESIKQVYVNKYLVHGFSDDAIQEALVCPKCGFKKYLSKVECFVALNYVPFLFQTASSFQVIPPWLRNHRQGEMIKCEIPAIPTFF